MKIIRNSKNICEDLRGAVFAIGNFDGFHKGHKAVIDEAKELAAINNKKVGVISFYPHPVNIINPSANFKTILNFRDKVKHLEAFNLDLAVFLKFSSELMKLSAKDFVEKILVRDLAAFAIVTGDNFNFGANRGGNRELLANYSSSFQYLPLELKKNNDERYSSTRLRDLIVSGNFQEFSDMTERAYAITGKVIEGRRLGRELGFPTANIKLSSIVLPPFGVYDVTIFVDGNAYRAIANLGVKPSFGRNNDSLEVHIFDFNDNLYGKKVRVVFNEYIRSEIKFTNLENLKLQISQDILYVKQKVNHD